MPGIATCVCVFGGCHPVRIAGNGKSWTAPAVFRIYAVIRIGNSARNRSPQVSQKTAGQRTSPGAADRQLRLSDWMAGWQGQAGLEIAPGSDIFRMRGNEYENDG
ncbi:hypothetical protein BO223_06905 [Faecalibaculum rodentium]|uniref:Uncharacterized protein n=1 Tax=Faecalibaculum rodentium TaxID=1702221 RepID=A0A1Q9YJS5_9FIRM|nr:hypothetical protein BO223_06905 [Faecalibaculum rodentium]